MSQGRSEAMDLLRGLIMVFMALDHASAFVGRMHFTEMWGLPFEGYPDVGWWLTRFLSHLCAPGFFLLMGMGITWLSKKRKEKGWTDGQVRKYLLKRGGIILLIMFFLEFPAWGFGSIWGSSSGGSGFSMPGDPNLTFLIPSTVLYGLATSMMASAFLWKAKNWMLPLITIACFALSAWYVGTSEPKEPFLFLEHMFLVPGASTGALVIYPLIPWLGICTFGMWLARLSEKGEGFFRKTVLGIGILFLIVFFPLRYSGLGNFQISAFSEITSFFSLVKYPPSLCFALWTVGVNLILLFLFSFANGQKWLTPIRVFGQTAMFFYIVHLYLYGILGIPFPTGSGIALLYLMWLLGLIPLFFICRWYIGFKRGKPEHSIWKMI